MDANGKSIQDWFSLIEQGQVVLPRFQRHEAWRERQIIGLLENVLRKPWLPIGALLMLKVGDREPFHSRPIVGAPKAASKPDMHLLDGQQRMTALWRALTENYEDLSLFVDLQGAADDEADPEVPADDVVAIKAVRRWMHKGERRPIWIDKPNEQWKARLIPLGCLRPGSAGEQHFKTWRKAVKEAGDPLTEDDNDRVLDLRARVAAYRIPYLELPIGTGRETALKVFINMNTSASPLKAYDIVVAQLEEATGQSLHDKVKDLLAEAPDAGRYGDVEDNLLSVAALLAGKPPLKTSYLDPSFGADVGRVWPRLVNGFRRGTAFLKAEGMFGEGQMPSDVAVYLTCALWADVSQGFDAEGAARTLIRKVLWRSVFTDRYGKTSATRAFSDYKLLSAMIAEPAVSQSCDLFDIGAYPLPDAGELTAAGWPTRKDRLPRAILATSLRAGGLDFADGAPAAVSDLGKREYHHIYPVAVLKAVDGEPEASRALNCALVTWITNRKIAAKTPADYIKARADAAHLGESEVRHRLATHLVPYEELVAGDYDAFLAERARRVHSDMTALCEGREPARSA